jgi:hypothetical protein
MGISDSGWDAPFALRLYAAALAQLRTSFLGGFEPMMRVLASIPKGL